MTTVEDAKVEEDVTEIEDSNDAEVNEAEEKPKVEVKKDEGDDGAPETTFVVMTSCQRRRFKRALQSGKSRDEALILATTPDDETTVKTETKPTPKDKLNAVQDKISKNQRRRRNRQSAIESIIKAVIPKSSIKRLGSNSIRMCIVPEYPSRLPIDEKQMKQIQEAIIDTTIERTSQSIKPRFLGTLVEIGRMICTCANIATAKWLRDNFEVIKRKCGLRIILKDDGGLPKPHHIRGHFPQSGTLTSEKILLTIQAQNHGIISSNWKVLQRIKDSAEMVQLLIAVDDLSLAKLQELGGQIAYRFGNTYFGLESAENGQEAAA